MFRYSLSWYIFTFTLLELIIKTHLTIHDSSHGFISKNPRYFDEDLSNIHEEITSSLRINDVSLKLLLKFEPSFLDFKLRPLGVPHMEKVTLFNIDNKSIDMTSISGNTVHFHSSFFEDKRIPPMGNTSFNVVFLGREEGFVESNLFIHTTEGHLKYNVKGASTFSHYRLRPIIGIKLPLNSTFSPLIYMHNPHSEPIQIVEIYSSGGDFHLELPSGEQEGPNDMWEIPPQHTKAVIRVRFQAKVVQNHTAYVRIKLSKPEEILVVPLEVEVTSNVGIFHPQGSIDFGIGGTLDAPKQLKLCVHNPLKKPIRIHSISTTSKAMKITYENIKITPELKRDKIENSCVDVGSVTLNWQKAYETQDFSGHIVIKYRNGKNKSEIPYYITVLKGGLSFNPLTTTYFNNDKTNDLPPRNFKIKNDFQSPVKILNVTIPEDAQNLFSIDSFTPLVLKPQEEKIIFKISLKTNIQLSNLKINSNIILKTNVSDILIPLLSYSGKLKVHLPFKSKDYSLDLGLISYNSKKEVHFLIVNHNPVDIQLKSIQSSIPMTSAEFYGCGRSDYQMALFQVGFKNLTRCINLKADHYAVIKLTVETSNSEGQIWGDIQIETQFENLSVPVHFKIAPGKLEIGPDRMVFDQCFPGKICSHPLRIHSTFGELMVIEDIISLPPDDRITSKHIGHIPARATKVIGHLYLNPNLHCGNQCYAGLQHDTTAQWLKTFMLSKYVPDFDMHLVNVFYNRYVNITSNGLRKWQNITMRLDTSEIRGHIFRTRVKMSWPSLLDSSHENRTVIQFPLTQVGNITYKNITFRNPSSFNLIIQLVLDKDYPNLDVLFDGIPTNFIPQNSPEYSMNHRFFFHNRFVHLNEFYDLVNIKVSQESIPILLLPGQNYSVTIGFRSEDTSVNSALLFIRNNLTILEIVRLKGQGATPLFKFGNRKPGSLQPLSFDMTEKHLKDCERDKHFNNPTPNLTVKRSFTAKNIGDVTIYVNSFRINDLSCEGYGFKVVNCVPFVLPPNGTKKIDIAFTPDLTLTKVTRLLVLGTSLNFPVNYTLVTTFPSQYLNMCSDLIMRPFWEIYLSYLTIIFMFIIFVVIITVAVMDADRIKKEALEMFFSPSSSSVQPVLDLRSMGQQIREEIRSSKQEHTDHQKASSEKSTVDKNLLKNLLSDDLHRSSKNGEIENNIYSAIIPATGKGKKKLSKKNSNESQILDTLEMQQKKPTESPPKPVGRQKLDQSKIFEEKKSKDPKKPFSSNRKYTKNTIVPAYEEETSSTTTESSSNNEDPEKENQRQTKICSRKQSSNKQEVTKTSTEELSTNEVKPNNTTNPAHKLERQKSVTKFSQKSNNKEDNKQQQEQQQHTKQPREKKTHKSAKERKEKQHNKKMFTEKNSSNKSTSNNTNNELSRTSPNLRISPPVTSSAMVWGENRAKFSDVVARADNNNTIIMNTKPLSQSNHNSSKPTMYVEPYKQTTQELGPIGSRRMDYWQDNTLTHSSNNREIANNSFFTNSQDLRIDNGSTNFLDDYGTMETWNQQQNYMNLLEANVCSENNSSATAMEDPWNRNLLNSNAYWNAMLPDNLAAQPSQQTNQQSGYLWGSSPVWQPWAPPEVPRTPTRTPPGFDEFLQRKREEQQIQQRDTYSPFNTSNIWTNQSTSPWNYQGQ